MTEYLSKKNKTFAVVTGASSGIGLALCEILGRNGFDMIMAAEDDGLVSSARDIEALGSVVTSMQVDLSTYEGVEDLVAEIRAAARPVDALVLNAGIGTSGDFVRDAELEHELKLINLHVTSAVHLAKRVLPAMVERGHGRALFTSSIAATMPEPFEATYAASKAFLQSFSEAIRNELKDSGVTVTALMPGPTDTEFFERAGLGDTKLGASSKDDAREVAQAGYEAMMAGKDHVVAGSPKNTAQVAAARLMPQRAQAAAHRKMNEPGSAESTEL